MCVCTFQLRKFTGCDSERVNTELLGVVFLHCILVLCIEIDFNGIRAGAE